MRYDVIIVGGGAAGLFCAIEASKRGRRTLVIEHNHQPGRKILISGGGRCNFTNIGTSPENFVSANPHFCKSALAGYTPQDFIDLVKKHRIDFYEKKLGQLFCRNSARQVVEMLLSECERYGAEIRTGCSVKRIDREKAFAVETSQGTFSSESLVIATGGLSFPKIGATDFGYRVAKQFGIERTELRPSLVAMVFEEKTELSRLAGVSVGAVVNAGRQAFRENILFTHRGLSGPATLQASNYWKAGEPVAIDLLPDVDLSFELETTRTGGRNFGNFLGRFLPNRFAEAFAADFLPDGPIDRSSKKQREDAVESIKNWQVRFSTTEGYDRAEVTLGGISTSELSSQTMEAKKVPGLYFIGEIVDVTGWLGGYNFQWAWASAFAAGKAV